MQEILEYLAKPRGRWKSNEGKRKIGLVDEKREEPGGGGSWRNLEFVKMTMVKKIRLGEKKRGKDVRRVRRGGRRDGKGRERI